VCVGGRGPVNLVTLAVDQVAIEDVRFEPVKEHRDWYFVEYSPPLVDYRFSTIQLVSVETKDPTAVADAMEAEARLWLKRYPIPVMVSSFSVGGDVISLHGTRPCNHLLAWDQRAHAEPLLVWRLVSNDELPDIALDRDFIQTLFRRVPRKSRDEIEDDAVHYARTIRIGRWLVFLWAVVVPAGVALLEWWSDLLGLVVVIYALCKAGMIALRLAGYLPKSREQRQKEAETLQMKHHDYHCTRNPEAFAKLKAENFQRWEVERTLAESETLKAAARVSNVDG
jgi:hypothetical protein